MTVQVDIRRRGDHLVVSWDDGRARGSARFDHLPEAVPRWLGEADELLDGADRRSVARILDAIVRWAEQEDVEIGIWHADGDVELLT